MAKELSELYKKYDGFSAPDYSIVINNTNLKEKYVLGDFRLEVTAKYEAGSCSFSIKNGFESGKDFTAKIDPEIEKLIKLGTIVEASIGYGTGEKTKLFLGYIDNMYIDYKGENGFSINVDCLDAKGIMMSSLRSEVKKDVKKYGEAIKNIFNDYPKLITKQTVEADYEFEQIEQHNESDYGFVVGLLKKINHSFYIINGEVIVRPIDKSKPEGLKLKKSDMIKSVSLHMSLKDQVSGVLVRSSDEKNPEKTFEGKAERYKNIVDAKSVSVGDITKLVSKKMIMTLIDHSVSSDEDAKKLAEAKLNSLSYLLLDGSIECIGIPDLKPDEVLEIEGFGGTLDKKYYVKKVTHTIGENGYTTKCELGANVV